MLVRWGSVLWDFHLKNKDYAESTVRFTAPLRERLSCGRSSPCLLVSLEKGRCMQMSRGPWKICWLNPHLSSLIWVNRRQFQHSTLASNAQTHGRHYPQSYTHNIVIYIYIVDSSCHFNSIWRWHLYQFCCSNHPFLADFLSGLSCRTQISDTVISSPWARRNRNENPSKKSPREPRAEESVISQATSNI